MGKLEYKVFTRRHRPHYQPLGSTLFVTFRLVGSIPKSVVREYEAKKLWLDDQLRRAQDSVHNEDTPELRNWLARVEDFNRRWFMKFEDILHRADCGPMWLQDERLAERVAENLHRLNGINYRLDAYSIMSNHVHTVFKPVPPKEEFLVNIPAKTPISLDSDHPCLSRIMQSVKGRSARECNLVLSRTGQFWEHESFDHVIRPGKFAKTIRYVLNNPVKARLVDDWRDWHWNYCRKELSDEL
jgi:putative transposase